MKREREVVIVGAGPAGRLLAWLLATRGVPVHVVERHADFAREFRGEGIQASVVRHLEELGLLDELSPTRMVLLDPGVKHEVIADKGADLVLLVAHMKVQPAAAPPAHE